MWLTTLVANKKRSSGRGREVETDAGFVAASKLIGLWKKVEADRPSGFSRKAVKLEVLMPVGGKNERDIEPLACGVELRLFESVVGRKVLGLGLNQGDGDRLRVGINLNA